MSIQGAVAAAARKFEPYRDAIVAVDFLRRQFWRERRRYRECTHIPGCTFTRASTGYAETSGGVLVPFASGGPRITDKGLLVEEARNNAVLWNRDHTNAAWTKSNMTAAKDQTGPDGVANSASSLTATAGNATSLQAITLGSSARFQTAYVKRITGSGTVEMTMDNGATWTAVTVTSTWTRVSIPTQTLANPTVGFRIVTSGDAIAVDFVDNENGAFATSPIETTTASATRAADDAALSIALPATPTLVASVLWVDLTTTRTVLSWNDGTVSNRVELFVSNAEAGSVFAASGGATQISAGAATTGGRAKIAGTFDGADYRGSANGGTITAATGKIAPVGANSLNIGRFNATQYFNNYIERIVVYPLPQTQAQLNALTT